MKILHVCSELYPLLKTGGLADVLGALPQAQNQIGLDARVLLPAYPAIIADIQNTQVVAEFNNFAGHVVLRYGEYNGVGIYLIDAPHLYGREAQSLSRCLLQRLRRQLQTFCFARLGGGRISHRFR